MPANALETLALLLGEDFSDLRPLGEDGGLSRLFSAHKRSLDLDVVIKRMRMDPNRPADVQREARVMTSLRHQYLPRIFDFKTDGDGYCYTIMERIPGCTLRQYLRQKGALPQKQALLWMKQLAQAAAYMHSQQPPIIHSDIKPENIMITPQGDICLIDFNASLELRDDGAEAVGATMRYAAPEQYNFPLERFGDPQALFGERRALYDMALQAQPYGKVTARTDLYAIGACAYFMLTGYDPACWNQERIPLERYDIQLGDPLRLVIERCMELEPSRRFSDAKELLRALGGLARMDGRYRAWRIRCQAAALAVGSAFILSVFVALWGWLLLRQEGGEAYNSLILQAQEAEPDYLQAQELLMEAIALDRERPEAYANLGALLYRMGDYRQAVELLAQVRPDQTGSLAQGEAAQVQGQIQYVLGSCYYQLEEYDEALMCYQLAVSFCPEDPACRRELAVCAARTGNDALADQALSALAGMNRPEEDAGDIELVMGEIASARGEYEEALTFLSTVVRASDNHSFIGRAALQAAQCCRQLGSGWLEQEIEVLETAVQRLEISENGLQSQLLAEALIRRASAQPERRAESYEQALGLLQDLMNRGQPTLTVRQNTALVLEYLDRFDEAEALLLRLREDFPMDYRPSMRLALLCFDREGEKPAGQRDYSLALEYSREAEELCPPGVADGDILRLRELSGQFGP